MFEDSLLHEEGSTRKQRIALAAAAAQVALLTAFLVAPLLHPDALPLEPSLVVRIVTLLKPAVRVEPVKAVRAQAKDAFSGPPATATVPTAHGAMISRALPDVGDQPPLLALGGGMSTRLTLGGDAGAAGGDGAGPRVVVKMPSVGRPLAISSGVMAGRLLVPMRPAYPPIAKAAHVEGTVVVTATIDKTGRTVGVTVQSGPLMLREAALDAVRGARYQPYLLNGQPTEIVTTVSVNFHMGGS